MSLFPELRNFFCDDLPDLLLGHVKQCKKCATGILSVTENIPIFKMIFSDGDLDDIKKFITKEVKTNGDG